MAVPIFAYVCEASHIIPAAVGVVRFNRLTNPMRILAIFTILACFQFIVAFVAALWKHNNIFLDDYFALIEFSMLSGVYYFSVSAKTSRGLLFAFGVIYFIIWMAKVPLSGGPISIGGNMAVIGRIILIILSLVVAQETLREETIQILEMPVFWVIVGVILYAAGTIMIFGFSDHLLKSGIVYFEMAWRINWTLLIAANLFYTKAFLCNPRKETSFG
jgi:hypothetical protein